MNRSPFLSAPVGDVASEEAAYLQYAQDGWHFPLFLTPSVNLPEGSNLLFAGGVPIFSLVAKVIHGASGVTLNLLGPWYLLCCMLQTHSMFFLMKQITDRRPLVLAFASITAGLANAFLSRIGHISLFGQFVCIYPLALVIATTNGNYRARTIILASAALTLISMFVFAYFAIMNTLMFLAGVTSLYGLGLISVRKALIFTSIFFAIELAVAYAGGYFWAVGRADPAAIEGYRVYAFNLGSLVDSNLFPPGGRWEGSFFLGWGVIGLWLIIAATGVGPVRTAFSSNKWIVFFLGLLTAYSLSNRVQLFDYTIFAYPLPNSIAPLIGMARASGRLFWPIGYLLMASAFAITAARFPRLGIPLVAVAIALACYQSAAAYGYLRQVLDHPQESPLSYAQLRQIMSKFDSVYLYPTTWCIEDPPNYFDRIAAYQQIEFVSAVLKMRSNSAITARKIKDCELEKDTLHRPSSGQIAFYMFDTGLKDAFVGDARVIENQCRRFEMKSVSGYMCSASWTRETKLPEPFRPLR